MDVVAAILIPLAMLAIMISMSGRLLLPRGNVFDVFAGIVLRDLFWIFMRGLGVIISLPFLILGFLIAGPPRIPRSRHRQRRRRNRRRRYRRW